ncbi:hypothetical protein IT6_02660 [Methylacidiphilum caldifontis]|uniref:hypothetical protein n=1 Tax=Methylacidiphilum caldifontis TaxID=2795386 RepID=UPI001A8E47A6|nr:hypothetical protein [Methylacidiphilum caldifontis]QSR89205.1 hypothetical protein IT6_02660 [Methylacidiphilum caldifontis]
MVAAPNQQVEALTKYIYKQRFNVAASRAKAQMWLLYSIGPKELHPDCMRKKLLDHFLNYKPNQIDAPDFDKCESKFEKEIATLIHKKGYAIELQYKALSSANYRIDIVIKGNNNRLAMECDGPHHEEPKQIQDDISRQRLLERCG